jgi:molybdate transport system permease protein
MELTAEDWQAVVLSLKVAGTAMLASLPFGIAMALILARAHFPGKAILNAVVHLPLVMPPVVTGFLLLILFGRKGPVGQFLAETFGIVLSFRWTGAALACAIMGFPLMVRSIRLSIEAIDRKWEEAASTLGAGPFWVFLTITLPLATPGIIAGMILSFAKSMGEFGATITFVSNIPGETRTLSAAIYSLLQVPGGDVAAMKLTLISIGISFLALILSEYLAQRARQQVERP